ncbi:MAG: hypothetical protein ACPLF9_08925, partial [Methanothermobacter tenebrarum]
MSIMLKLEEVDTPVFQLDGGESCDPISCLSSGRCKPLRRAPRPKASILVLTSNQITAEEKSALQKLSSDLKEGVKDVKVRRWKGFHEIFDLELEIRYDNYNVDVDKENYVRNIFQKLSDYAKAYDLFIVYMPEPLRSRIGGSYFKVKAYAIVNKIREQIIIKPTVDKAFRYITQNDILKYNDLVWNTALSIFTKLGGIPWKLKECMSPIDTFLAISTIMKPGIFGGKRRAGIAALQMYNNWGDYENSVYGKLMFIYEENKGMLDLGDNESRDKFTQLVTTIAREVKNRNVVVHLTDLYAKSFHGLLHEVLINNGANNVKIIRAQRSSPLRLY